MDGSATHHPHPHLPPLQISVHKASVPGLNQKAVGSLVPTPVHLNVPVSSLVVVLWNLVLSPGPTVLVLARQLARLRHLLPQPLQLQPVQLVDVCMPVVRLVGKLCVIVLTQKFVLHVSQNPVWSHFIEL